MLERFSSLDGMVLFGILVVAGFVGVRMVARLFRSERREIAESPLQIMNRRRILDVLRQACESTGKLEIWTEKGVARSRLFSGLIQGVDSNGLTVIVPQGSAPQLSSGGADIDCFLIHHEHADQSFFSFRTKVLSNRELNEDNRVLRLRFPAALEPFSRRNFQRAELPSKYLVTLRVWPWAAPLPEDFPNADSWEAPAVSFPPDAATPYPVRILDISCGGMKLSNIPVSTAGEREAFAVGKQLLIDFSLAGIGEDEPLDCSVLASVRYVDAYAGGKMLSLGIDFQERLAADGEGRPRWERVDERTGIPLIANWVFRYQIMVGKS